MFQPATSKYFGEQDARHEGQLHWPGVNGLPFRGEAIPNLKQRELADMPVVAHACHQVFDLSDGAQAKVFQWVRDRVRNGLFTLDWIERHWDDENKRMFVYVEWSQLYVQLPPKTMGSIGNGSPNHFTLQGS